MTFRFFFYTHSLWRNDSFFCIWDHEQSNVVMPLSCCVKDKRGSKATLPHSNKYCKYGAHTFVDSALYSPKCSLRAVSEQRKNTFVQLTSKLQAGSPAEDRSDCIDRHTLVQPRVLVAVQAAYNEVAPRQTPSAIQAQIYESPIQWPSVRAKTPSVPGNAHCSILPSNQGGLTGVANGKAPQWSKLEWRERNTLHIFANVEAFKCTLEAANSTWDWRAHVF